MDPRCRIQLMGGLRVLLEDRAITRFQTRKTALLLAYLALHLSRDHPRELLIEVLWPDIEPVVGRHRLRMALSSLRRQLEPPDVPAGAVIVADRHNVRLNPVAVTTDVVEFEEALRQAVAIQPGDHASPGFQRAITLYGSPLLPGFYEDWIVRERDRLAAAYLQAIRRVIDALEDAGEWEQAIAYARRAVEADPVREEGYQELIRLLAEDGQSAAARRQYEELERILRQEWGVAPSGAVRALLDQPGRVRQKGHGRRRGSTLAASFECDASSAPEGERGAGSETPNAQRPTPDTSFPLQFTRFFGREEQIERLIEMLSPAAPRSGKLVTLSGPGGIGKSRLATEVAARLAETFGGGIWFVPLADLMDAGLIAGAALDAMRLPRSPGIEPFEQLVAFLNYGGPISPHAAGAVVSHDPAFLQGPMDGTTPTLLVLDNFEHLVARGAQVVRQLRARVPNLTCLMTSRRRLGLSGERLFPLSPLPTPRQGVGCRVSGVGKAPQLAFDPQPVTPDAQHLTPSSLLCVPSVQLFVDRAQAVRPDFQITRANARTVAELCDRLEGLPLAIELAAARAGTLTPAQMLAQLMDRFDLLVSRKRGGTARHQTLQTAIGWSYHLLSPSLKRLFARLSVFRGGWTPEAAAAVCEEPGALDEIARLCDCSLAVADESTNGMRFRMLETVREYANAQLSSRERTATQRRHLDYFVTIAVEIESMLVGSEQSIWLARLETENDNLRAALGYCCDAVGAACESPDPHLLSLDCPAESGLRLAGKLGRFWSVRGYQSEGRERLKALLALRAETRTTDARAAALYVAGKLAKDQGDFEDARNLFERALSVYRALDDAIGIATCLGDIGNSVYRMGEFAGAKTHLEESLAIHRALANRPGIAASLCGLGLVAWHQGDNIAARSFHEQSLEIYRDLGNTASIAILLMNLGNVAIQRGDYGEAKSLHEESLGIQRQLGNLPAIAMTLNALGNVSNLQGDYAYAQSLYQDCLAINRELGNKHGVAGALTNLGTVAQHQGNYGAARELFEDCRVLALELGDTHMLSTVLANIGDLAAETGEWRDARAFHCDSLALTRELEDREGAVYSLRAFGRMAIVDSMPERAVTLWAAGETVRADIGYDFSPTDQQDFDSSLTAVRESLPPNVFAAAWMRGQGMTVEQAIAYALGEVEMTIEPAVGDVPGQNER